MPRDHIVITTKVRLSSFRRTARSTPKPIGADMPSALEPRNAYGFTLINKKKPYTLGEIEKLTSFKKVREGYPSLKKLHIPDSYTAYTIQHHERALDIWQDMYDEFKYVDEINESSGINNYLPEVTGPVFICIKNIDIDFSGCCFLEDFITVENKHNRDCYLIGWVLLDEFCGVCTWFQMDTDWPIEILEQHASFTTEELGEDPEDEDVIPPVPEALWYTSKRNISINNGYRLLDLVDIGKGWMEANDAEKGYISLKKDILKKLNWDYLMQHLTAAEPIASNWLKGILYLVANGFFLPDYSVIGNDPYYETESAPLSCAFGLYNKADDYFDYLDGYKEYQDMENPSICEVYAENIALLPVNKDKMIKLFKLFNGLFSVDPKKQHFNETEKYSIQKELSDIDIQQWKRAVCRRIKRTGKRFMGLDEAT